MILKRLLYLMCAVMILTMPSVCGAAENTDVPNAASDNKEETEVKDGAGESGGTSNPNEDGGTAEKEYEFFFNTTDKAKDSFNVQNYTVEDSEKRDMYDADKILRRDAKKGEAWVIYELPYLTEFRAESYHWPSDAVPMSFEVSKDGEVWNSAEIKTEVTPSDDRWTKIVYSAENIKEARYLKIVWGTEDNLENWWNPYFGGLWANVGQAEPTEVLIKTEPDIVLPMYDTKEICFEAEILDQIGEKLSGEIKWKLVDEDGESPTVSEDGYAVLTPDMTVGIKFTLSASFNGLSSEKEFTLCAPHPGDTDGDNKITKADLSFIAENLGAEITKENRLCDADKNGEIDIIDLAYAARYLSRD